jgi:hypothetical protein
VTQRNKNGTAGQDTDDNTMQRMRFACWMTKATNIHSEYVRGVLMTLLWQSSSANSPESYVDTYIACLIKTEMVFTAQYDLGLQIK